MKRINRLTYIIAVMLTLLFCLITCVLDGGVGGKAYAASTAYTSVIDDLRKADNFEFADYPSDKKDYSLQVIQIAESSDKELFIYVYQPCGEYKTLYATTARISTVSGDNKKYSDYKLTLLNANGVFQKYRVDGVSVSSEAVRYYDIPAIHRKWDSGIDKPSGNGNPINEVVYEVAQLWAARDNNGEVTYEMQKSEVITITDKRVGKLRYTDGFYLFGSEACDSHYIAFSTDKAIDTLYEADVEYMSQYFYHKGYQNALTHKVTITDDRSEAEPHKEFKTLKYTDKASNDGNGLFGHKYSWNRIESVADFIKKENLKDEALEDIKDKQWVLRFTETAFNFNNLSSNFLREYTEVSEVTVLRLKFETAGKVYNLGVVDNKQTGNKTPDNENDIFGKDKDDMNFWEYIWDCLKKLFTGAAGVWQTIVAVLVIVAAIVVVVLAVKFVKWVIKGLFK